MKVREEAAYELGHEERVYIECEHRGSCAYLRETFVYTQQAQVAQREKTFPSSLLRQILMGEKFNFIHKGARNI